MAKLSLEDVARYTEEMDVQDILQNQDMKDYTNEIQDVGLDVLKSLSSKEIAVATSIMQAAFTSQMIEDNSMLALMCLSQAEDFSLAMAQSLKVAIGIVLSEGWR